MWRKRVEACRTTSRSRRRRCADEVLALAADVEHAAAEGERDREPREHERRRHEQRLLQVEAATTRVVVGDPREEPVQSCALEDRAVGRQRVLARGHEHDEAADQEREQRREERREDPAGRCASRSARRSDAAGLAGRGLPGPGAAGRVGSSACSLTPPPPSRPPPVIARPSSSSVAVGGNSPTISPS